MNTGRPRFEVADIVHSCGDDYRRHHRLSAAQQKVLDNITACRTAALGGHVDECADDCGYTRISYNSCQDRHCPKCQALSRITWIEQRLARLLPVPHYHVVFTIPAALNPLALRNKKLVYDLLFQAATRTLIEIADDKNHLGGRIGLTAVLHSWGRNLLFHPHLHCVVTGGGLAPDAQSWIASGQKFFLPVMVLAKLFRGKFLHHLDRAWQDGRLDLAGSSADLADPIVWSMLKDRLYRTDWVVYAKPPFAGAEHVFRYLGNYTHRVAISNHRLVGFQDGNFTVKDYKNGGRTKRLTLEADEFIRRFLLHVLPKGFVRIRHYGLYAGRNVKTRLETALRIVLKEQSPRRPTEQDCARKQPLTWWELLHKHTGIDMMVCPVCGARLVRRRVLPAKPYLQPPERASPRSA